MKQPVDLQKYLYEIIKNEKRPIPKGILMEKIKNSSGFHNKQVIYDYIDSLIYNNQLTKVENGYLIENYINATLLDIKKEGIISVNTKLDGYVKVLIDDKNSIDYYINNINLNGALNGDKVEITLMDKFSKNSTQHAIVSKVIEHNTKIAVGTFKLIGNKYEISLDDKKNYLKVKLDNIDNLVNGHKILIGFTHFDNQYVSGYVKKVIGHTNDVGSDILSIVYSNDVEPQFDDDVINFVNSYSVDPRLDAKRRDITHLNIVSIDPATSKDLDDAVYVEKRGEDYYLSVSIADVSSYVPYKSLLDNKTINRATSIYLVDRVIPMLPHKLSNDECSLNENVKRRSVTCDMLIDKQGNIKQIDVYPSWIISRARLSYDEVNDLFANKPTSIDNDIQKMLFIAKNLHKILRNKKSSEGYIDFDLKEPKIIVDEKCLPVEIKIKERGTAQIMIEDFMVAANSSVTIKAKSIKNMPFIYRIHDKPSPDKIEKFLVEVRKTNFIVDKKAFETPTPLVFKNCLDDNKDNVNVHLLSRLLLRCMSKACYSVNNYHHFGLALKDYTHFTSPIRRYPDLIVHRLYWMYSFAPDLFSDNEREMFKNELEQLCEICSDKEVEAISIEREVNALKFCQYMSKRLNQEFDGIISAITSFGMFVELDNTIEGLVKIRNIGNDFWIYNEATNSIIGTKTNSSFNFGQSVRVRVVNVDISSRQIEFELVGYERNDNKNERRTNNRKINHRLF